MSTIAQREAERIRRQGILSLLYFAPGQSMTARRLRDELEAVHGQVATVDRVRADLIWLADVGLVVGSGDAAMLTERGRDVVLASGVAHEIRTTVHPALLADAEVVGLAHDLAARGVRRYVIQAFRSQGCRNDELCRNPVRERPLQDVGGELAGLFETFSVRVA